MDFVTSLLSVSYFRAFLVIVVSILAAVIANWVFTRICSRIVQRTATSFDDELLNLLRKPVFYSILLIGINIAIQVMAIPENATNIIIGVLKTAAILIWSVALLRLFNVTLKQLSLNPGIYRFIQKRTFPLFDNLGRIIVFAGAAYFLLLSWGINITAWVASAGIIGIAIGFAAKDTLANLFAGFFIMVDAPYKVGDFINLDSGERGRVTDIGIRSTRILTRDDVEITIPNSVIASAKIINESGGPYEKERVRITIGVAYGSDIDRVREILLEIALSIQYVQRDPAPRVRFRKFGESELVFQLLCWIEEPVLRGRVIDGLNSEVYRRFQKEGIEFPFPHRTVYMHSPKTKGE